MNSTFLFLALPEIPCNVAAVFMSIANQSSSGSSGCLPCPLNSVSHNSVIKEVLWYSLSEFSSTIFQVNSSPYEKGWIMKVEIKDDSELKNLKNSDVYAKFCEEEDAKHWVDCWQSRTGGGSYKSLNQKMPHEGRRKLQVSILRYFFPAKSFLISLFLCSKFGRNNHSIEEIISPGFHPMKWCGQLGSWNLWWLILNLLINPTYLKGLQLKFS